MKAEAPDSPEGRFKEKKIASFEQIINFIVKNALQHENKINSVGIVGDINE